MVSEAVAAGKAEAQPEAPEGAVRAKRAGQWIRVPLPIDDRTVASVRRSVDRALGSVKGERPVFVFEFDALAGSDSGRGTQFEDAYRLAKYLAGSELNAATTVAYVPRSIKGHAVLPALACDQLIMSESATMGEAGIDETHIDATLVAAYTEIAGRRRTVPVEVALGMLDKGREVLFVRTLGGTEFVTPAGLEELKKGNNPIQSQETWKPAGQPGQVTGSEGRNKFHFVGYLANDRRDVARALELSPEIARGNPQQDDRWHPIQINIKGPIKSDDLSQAQRLIDEQIKNNSVNFVCLWIDSAGGSPVDSIGLATYLAGLDPGEVRTVAYIPKEARADAALIALACDQVIMYPQAVLGGAGAYQMSEAEIAANRATIRDSLAPRKMRSWSLWAAMIDPQLDVFRCTRLGDVEYFSADELQREQPKANQGEKAAPWQKGEAVTTPGRPLRVNGTTAVEYHLATRTVENFTELKQFYGLENDPSLVEPSWASKLIEALRSDGVAVLLLIIGGVGLYIELHAPGVGIGGFIAAVCFLLFFWSRYLGGTAGWLEVTLFLTGVACLLLEVFVIPGFGIFGLGGGALVLASLVLASQTFVVPRNEYQFERLEHSLLTIAGATAGLIVAALVLRRWLPHAPLLQQMFLNPPEGAEADMISRREALVSLDNLLGASGTTTTPLGPGGKARFGSHLVDVMAEGEFIPRDTPVVVVEVHGSRVVVRTAGS
jgi:membrane-bound serine protease (ClpP class)